MDEIRVLVVDDHYFFRQGVIQTLSQEPDITVVGEADCAVVALEKALALLPDVVLLDIKLPDESGLAVASRLHRDCPYSKIIMLTVMEDHDTLLQAIKEGARGYLLKGTSADELISVIRNVHQGEAYVPPAMAGHILRELTSGGEPSPAAKLEQLTEREQAILELVAQGQTNREIAAALFLSEKTVKHYMTNILQKLQVRNRVEAALLAVKKAPVS